MYYLGNQTLTNLMVLNNMARSQKQIDRENADKAAKKIDKFYVINLEKNIERREAVEKTLKNAGIDNYEIFSATKGIAVRITDLKSGKKFLGSDLDSNKISLIKGQKYTITCPEADSITFDFLGYAGSRKASSELGLWCSIQRIWKNAQDNQYNRIVVFEDDIVAPNNFKTKLDLFTSNLPQSTDVAYLDYRLKTKGEITKINEYVHKFTQKTAGYATWAMLFNAKGIEKLQNIPEYTLPLDKFYWCYSNGNLAYKGADESLCIPHINYLEFYASNDRLVSISGAKSDIAAPPSDVEL